MNKLSAQGIKLLRKVKRHILAQPHRLIMGDWIERNTPGEIVNDYNARLITPKCGTVGCIAGWCCLLGKGMEFVGYESGEATKLLGLSEKPDDLFYTDYWEDPMLRSMFALSSDPKERAKIVAEVIDGFIENHR